MPGKNTTGQRTPSGKSSSRISSGSGMQTVPRHTSPLRRMRQGTMPSAPETSSGYTASPPSGRFSWNASSAASDMVAFPQNSPPIICKRMRAPGSVGFSRKPTCSLPTLP